MNHGSQSKTPPETARFGNQDVMGKSPGQGHHQSEARFSLFAWWAICASEAMAHKVQISTVVSRFIGGAQVCGVSNRGN